MWFKGVSELSLNHWLWTLIDYFYAHSLGCTLVNLNALNYIVILFKLHSSLGWHWVGLQCVKWFSLCELIWEDNEHKLAWLVCGLIIVIPKGDREFYGRWWALLKRVISFDFVDISTTLSRVVFVQHPRGVTKGRKALGRREDEKSLIRLMWGINRSGRVSLTSLDPRYLFRSCILIYCLVN